MSRNIIQNLKFRKITWFEADKLSALLEQGYLSKRRGTKPTKKETFSPSSIGYGHGTCPRYWYMVFNGCEAEDTTDALGVANMANGVAAHDRIQGVFEELEILIDKEVPIRLNDPPVFGYIDLLVRWDNEVVVGEIKTARQESFLFRQNSMKPSVNHLLQILLYMKATGKQQGFFYYENKNTQEFLIIPVQMDEKNEKIIEDSMEWLRAVRKNWETGELPKRPFGKRNKNCKNCPIFNECWNNYPEGTAELPAMEVPEV